jgi:hypothetical protein
VPPGRQAEHDANAATKENPYWDGGLGICVVGGGVDGVEHQHGGEGTDGIRDVVRAVGEALKAGAEDLTRDRSVWFGHILAHR